MNGTSFTAAGLFLEGLLSFFTPCVLPLVPLYIGYLTSGIKSDDPHHRRDTFIRTVFFVLGISVVFLAAGLGSSALQVFFRNYTIQFQLFGGFLLIVLGLMAVGVIRIPFLEKEYRIPGFKQGNMGFVQAFLMGFFFSFAWSPCIGPLLASAILAASSAPSQLVGIGYLAAYACGFIIPFLVIGLFTDAALEWLKKHSGIVKYTGIIGGLVVAGMGAYMLVEANMEIRRLQIGSTSEVQSAETAAAETAVPEGTAYPGTDSRELDAVAYDFTLKDAEGTEHKLSDYIGKPALICFYGTWCHYCNEELPSLQKIHDDGRVEVILIAAPGANGEGDIEYVEQFMKDGGYSMKVLYDMDGAVSVMYGISGYPTTFALQKDGNFLGYSPGYMPEDVLKDVVEQLTSQ